MKVRTGKLILWALVALVVVVSTPRSIPAATVGKARLPGRYEFFNPGKAVRELGLPQTPARVALRKAVEWYRSRGYAP